MNPTKAMAGKYRSLEWPDETKRDVGASLPDGWNRANTGRKFNRGCTLIRTEPVGLTAKQFAVFPQANRAVHPRSKFFACLINGDWAKADITGRIN